MPSRKAAINSTLVTRRSEDASAAGGPGAAPEALSADAEPSTRFRLVWVVMGLAGLGLLISVHLTGQSHHVLTFHGHADKIEHIGVFGGLMFWFGQLYRRGVERALIALLLAMGGVLLEFIQHALGGYAEVEYGDMLANLGGVVLGAALLRSRLAGTLAWIDQTIARYVRHQNVRRR